MRPTSLKMEYPYAPTWSKKTVQELFDSLVEYVPVISTLVNFNGLKDKIPQKYKKATKDRIIFITIDTDLEEYRNINIITDFFTEEARLTTSKRSFMRDTPMEMWRIQSDDIIRLAERKFGSRDPYYVRTAAFEFTKESQNFRPTIALSIYRHFKPSNILDISAGWGDRLIGALAYSKIHPDIFRNYIGFDPNINLQRSYAKIIDTLAPENVEVTQFNVFPIPFEQSTETLLALKLKYDLVFSSIPYFDFEQYDIGPTPSKSRKNQSIVRYPDIKIWIIDFLIPTIRISSRFLEIGGFLALNMEGQFVTMLLRQYDEIFFSFNLKYEGIIAYASDIEQDKKLHPIYVWRRTY